MRVQRRSASPGLNFSESLGGRAASVAIAPRRHRGRGVETSRVRVCSPQLVGVTPSSRSKSSFNFMLWCKERRVFLSFPSLYPHTHSGRDFFLSVNCVNVDECG